MYLKKRLVRSIDHHLNKHILTLLIMPRLFEHKWSGTIWLLQAGCVFLTPCYIIIVIHQLYSASEIVTRSLGQLKVDAGLVNQEWRPDVKMATYVHYIDDICINDIHSNWLPSMTDE